MGFLLSFCPRLGFEELLCLALGFEELLCSALCFKLLLLLQFFFLRPLKGCDLLLFCYLFGGALCV